MLHQGGRRDQLALRHHRRRRYRHHRPHGILMPSRAQCYKIIVRYLQIFIIADIYVSSTRWKKSLTS
jgi:hypothetical protein